MSLDGFITALDDDHDKPLGGDGRLHDWLSEGGGPAGSRPSGASGDVFDELVAAGVLDELEIHQIPVLVGQGRRLFDHLGPDHIELRLSRIVDAAGVTSPLPRPPLNIEATRPSRPRPVCQTLYGNVAGGRPYPLTGVPYTPPSEILAGVPYTGHPLPPAAIRRRTPGSERHAR
jgi:RibD C-terminal domain